MNTADYFRTLFDSLYWGRDRILAAAASMSDEEYTRDTGLTYKSLRAILTHNLVAEAMYFARLRGVQAPAPDSSEGISEQNLPSVEALSARWSEEEKIARTYLESLTDDQLTDSITYTRRDGVTMTQPVWEILTQVHQHGLQHRAEAAEALTILGRSPGNIDFLIYMNER